MFSVGERVLIVHDWSKTEPLQEGTIQRIKINQDMTEIMVDGQWYYAHAFMPLAARAEVEAVQRERARLKKAYDDSISLVFELRNKAARGEYK